MESYINLPRGWELAALSETINNYGVFSDGDWVESKDQDPDGDVRLIQLADVGDGFFRDRSNRFLTYEKALKLRCTFLEAGDLLIARMPDPLGRACIFPGNAKKCVTVVDVCIVRTGKDGANHRWLMHAINSPQFRKVINKYQSGSTRKRISRKNLAKIQLPLPPLSEQERIVSRIEELFTQLDAGVASLKRVKAALKRYKASVLKAAVEGRLVPQDPNDEPAEELLRRTGKKPLEHDDLPELAEGWCWCQIGDVSVSLKNGVYKPKEYYNDVGIACLRMYNIDDGNIVWKDIKRMILTDDEIETYRLLPGDILINRVNSRELVGKACVFPKGLETTVYESKNIRLRINQSLANSNYINYCFGAFRRDYFNFHAQQVVGMASINQTQITQMPIPIPPLREQVSIVTEVELRLSLAKQAELAVEAGLKRAWRLRQAILKRAFEGRLL
jgi:type I restriction enzyme, S subunit